MGWYVHNQFHIACHPVGLCFFYASCTSAFGVVVLYAAVIYASCNITFGVVVLYAAVSCSLVKPLRELLRALFFLFYVIQVKQWGMRMSIAALWGAFHGLQLIEI